MRLLTVVLLLLVLAESTTLGLIAVAGRQRHLTYGDDRLYCDSGPSSPRLHYVQCSDPGDIQDFRLLADGQERTIGDVLDVLRDYDRRLGHRGGTSQVANDEWVIDVDGSGTVRWFGFFPKAGMAWKLRHERFTADDTIDDLVTRAVGHGAAPTSDGYWSWR